MKNTELAYVGALMDGEGSVGCQVRNYIRKDKSTVLRIDPHIDIMSSVSFPHISRVQEMVDFSTRLTKKSRSKLNKNWKDVWTLSVGAEQKNITEFIKTVRPYLRLKGERLDVAEKIILKIDVEENNNLLAKLNQRGIIRSSKRKVLKRKS